MAEFYPDTETILCLSISARPGNFGNRFHNYLFRELGMNYVYLSREVNDLASAIEAMRTFGVRGCGVSMPYKVDSIPLMDEVDDVVRRIGALNTIVNESGKLKGYNTDHFGLKSVFDEVRESLPLDCTVEVLGSGGAARSALAALIDTGFKNIKVRARSEASGRELASKFGATWVSWNESLSISPRFLVNATSVGFKEPETFVFPLPKEFVTRCEVLVDVVATPLETSLVTSARKAGVRVFAGPMMSLRQAIKQFQLYTGVTPQSDLVERGFAWATRS